MEFTDEIDVNAVLTDLHAVHVALEDVGVLISNYLKTRDEALLQIALGTVDAYSIQSEVTHDNAEIEMAEDGSLNMSLH